MQLEIVRIIADALAHATYGVNAYLADVPRDAGDPVPADVTVLDETRDAKVARQDGQALDETDPGPELHVFLAEPTPMEPSYEGATATAESFGVAVKYRARKGASDEGVRDAYYTMRAVRRSLAELRKNAQADDRLRNSVQLIDVLSVRHAPATADDDAQVVTGLVATVQAMDFDPDF